MFFVPAWQHQQYGGMFPLVVCGMAIWQQASFPPTSYFYWHLDLFYTHIFLSWGEMGELSLEFLWRCTDLSVFAIWIFMLNNKKSNFLLWGHLLWLKTLGKQEFWFLFCNFFFEILRERIQVQVQGIDLRIRRVMVVVVFEIQDAIMNIEHIKLSVVLILCF